MSILNLKSFLYRKSNRFREVMFYLRFIRHLRYKPNFLCPQTFNEKIVHRKKNSQNKLFKQCSDKVLAKEWVISKGFADIVIPNYFLSDKIECNIILSYINQYGSILIKANHNSGPVFLLSKENTEEEILNVCISVNNQLKVDYGKLQGELWYSDINRKILIEKRIYPEDGENDLKDYKFHVFKQHDGSFKIVLQVDFDRSTNHNRSFFDENLNWLPFSLEYPTVQTKLLEPKNYQKMLDIVKKLAEPFSYVRVDLYNVDGIIYFGELTFAHGSGTEIFSNVAYDKWMGKLWVGNPRD
ncbi:glycosyltransferase [Colwellia sp. MT41]|uniref:ATP-grasp fold amidoligase family protein n=1 Tax=Colwellia sp. MT41 TaxID=58049 RepID=UPI000717A322|nr:ATP-grasp fold amidoligase family protein [Colwellia sp. MT41]ALO33659.1 glycosyltransferase [Colwellia sp. MT41]